jgi:dGTPase
MYDTLLTVDRIRLSTRGALSLAQTVESDRARVIYSTSFRRLQGKTQVFPLDKNAAVRTRLTHSLEVANVGRFLATMVLEKLDALGLSQKLALVGDTRIAFSTITESACLLHDIGNPPFGHFGEAAISTWFSRFEHFPDKEIGYRIKSHPWFLDFQKFDGNPQGFRIATRIGGDSASGLNLTLSQLGSMLKYSATPPEVSALKGSLKKAGVFGTEEPFLQRLREKFSLKPGQRFPLAYLMEAADDISYCLSDIEDGIENDILDHEEAVAGILKACGDSIEATDLVTAAVKDVERSPAVDPVIGFRSSLIRSLVFRAADQYVDSHEAILAGELPELIPQECAHGRLLKAIKAFARERVYNHKIPRNLELSGASIINGLLDQYGKLLSISRSEMADLISGKRPPPHLAVHERLYSSIAGRHMKAYVEQAPEQVDNVTEWCLRAHLIVDFISGMTDQFALDTYQRLLGIRF